MLSLIKHFPMISRKNFFNPQKHFPINLRRAVEASHNIEFKLQIFRLSHRIPSTKMFNVYNDNKMCINQMKAIFTWKHKFSTGSIETTKIINIPATSV